MTLRASVYFLFALFLCLAASRPVGAKTPNAEGFEFFETKVRPLLLKHCLECHGAEKQEGGLRLDSREAILQGGDSGPAAVVLSEAESTNSRAAITESLILQAVKHRDLEMPPPPKEKLADADVATLQSWIEIGLPWSPKTTASKSELEKRWETHWAFQPIQNPTPPDVEADELVQNNVDQFVLKRLEEAGHQFAKPADRLSLIRRAYDDLIGLPPGYDEVQAFEKDTSPNAFEKVVEELLARKEYGQRWGRHWLDVARYADTKGPIDGGEQRYAFAHTYRDYVIDSFNDDKPFDRFVLEQIAADKLDLGPHDPALAAMGFLTLGNKHYERIHEIMDDRIDVVGRGLMGLTMGCARCHTHKFDPIPTADYYSWYGVFRSSTEPYYYDKPLLAEPTNTESPEWAEFQKDYAKHEKKLKEFRRTKRNTIQHEMRAFAADYLEYVAEEVPEHRTVAQFARKTARTTLRCPTLHGEGGTYHWKEYVNSLSEDDPVFGIWHRLAALRKEELPARFAATMDAYEAIHPAIRAELAKEPPRKLGDVARAIGRVLEQTYGDWQQLKETQPEVKQFDDPEKEQLRSVLYGADSPCVMTFEQSVDFFHITEHDRVKALEGDLEEVFFDHARVAPPRALVLRDKRRTFDPYVFVRGDPKSKGPKVPRRFLKMMQHIDDREPFGQGSGRLELAKAIVHPDNPLTARVIVNRVWGWHFTKALVRTPSDFGVRSLPPTHPELLDFLATFLRENGWSLKELHRLIMLSRTYQQSSNGYATLLEQDPDNELIGRANRHRLDFESFRDSLLAASGTLDTRMGGVSTKDILSSRRSIYLLIQRLKLSSTYSTFDFPNPDLSTPQRVTTISPQQALFVMNHPLLLKSSEQAAAVARGESSDDNDRAMIRSLYRTIFARDPDKDEVAAAKQFVDSNESSSLSVWQNMAHAMLQSNEFMFVP